MKHCVRDQIGKIPRHFFESVEMEKNTCKQPIAHQAAGASEIHKRDADKY